MTRTKRLVSLCIVLIMAMFFVSGCKPETPPMSDHEDTTGEYQEILYTRYVADCDTYDPYGSTSAQHMIYTNSTFDMLIRNDPDTGEIIPYLAREWVDVNGDGKVWDFHLEENVTFHDGSKFTAEDVKFTWEYASAAAGNVIKGITAANYVESIECPSTYTVRFNLKSSMFDFPTYLETSPIYSKTAFENMDPAEAATIGCGPYYYDKTICIPGVQFGMTRYEDYWGGTKDHPTKQIIWKVIPENDTAYAALETGEIDFVCGVAPESYDVLAANPDLEMHSRTGANSYYLGFNYKSGKFDDLEFRKAICQAINKDDIVEVAYFGGVGGSPSNNFCVPTGKGYVEVEGLDFDAEAAKATLERLGYKDLKLKLIFYASCKKVAEVVQANLADIGVSITLQQVDGTNWTAFKAAGKDFDIFIDYAAYQGALLYNFDRFFVAGGSSNVYGFYSAEYEGLQANVQNAGSLEEMYEEFAVLQQWVADNIPIFPLTFAKMLGASKRNIEGLVLAPTTNYLDLRTVYGKKR